MTKLRIGIVGAGRRVLNNYLPALSCIGEEFEVAWVHARMLDRLKASLEPWGVRPLLRITPEAIAEIDVLAVSVPIAANAPVLAQFQQDADRLRLVIDTPISGSLGQARKIWPLIKSFRSATVTEDFMNFPDFRLARDAATKGLIGKVGSVVLDGMGHYYHGLALIRSFAQFAPVRATRRTALGGDFVLSQFRLGNGLKGSILYPYRRFQGMMGVVGQRGAIITSSESMAFMRRPESVYLLKQERGDTGITGVSLTGKDDRLTLELPQVARLMSLPYADKSDLNIMRSCGLMEVFRSLVADNINNTYGPRAAIYDNMTAKFATRLPLLWDPLTLIGSDFGRLLMP
jgi:hypothetical protein